MQKSTKLHRTTQNLPAQTTFWLVLHNNNNNKYTSKNVNLWCEIYHTRRQRNIQYIQDLCTIEFLPLSISNLCVCYLYHQCCHHQ